MPSSIRKVVIAGARGSLGRPITKALLEAGYQVTALTRNASTAVFPSGVRAISVEYTSEASLKHALIGQDALISTLAADEPEEQHLLFDAAIAAGIQRIILSEFGSDLHDPKIRSLPCYANKVAVLDHIKAKVVGTNTTYTFVENNAFLDYCLDHNIFFNRNEKKVQLLDGGDVPFTVTPLERVGQGVVGVLQHPDETANRTVKIHGRAVTQKQLLELYQKHSTAEGWQVTEADTQELLKSAFAVFNSDPSNIVGWLFPMIWRAALGKGVHVDWSRDNDNDLLGVKILDDGELEAYVKASVA